MIRALSAAALLLLSGCRAELVESSKRMKGPVAEVGLIDPGGGRVRYALKGPSLLVRKRRADAFKRMARYCEGEDLVRIEKEETREDVETPYYARDLDESIGQQLSHYKVEIYRHIRFRCVERP
jgi:hypothetical protein